MKRILKTPPLPKTQRIAEVFLFQNAQKSGPHSPNHVLALLASGKVTPGTKYWHEGLDDWKDLMRKQAKRVASQKGQADFCKILLWFCT